MKVAISCDHRGVAVVEPLKQALRDAGHEPIDVPLCTGEGACDYPDMAYAACLAVRSGEADRAVLICGSGIGMSIAANKVHGIRAALVHDEVTAQLSRRHNDANALCLSAEQLSAREIGQIVRIWLATDFEGGRHARARA